MDSPDAPLRKWTRKRFGATFSATKILDLEFSVRYRRIVRPETVRIKLFTPRGHLYQTLTVDDPYAESAEPRTRRVGPRWVAATLPVAGTTIVWGSLYGEWRAEFYVDDSTKACRATSFTIQP